jgi:Family of unknown function (DUF6502)
MSTSTSFFNAPSKADVALGAALRVMTPLLKFLLRSGVTHQMLSNALKKEMLDCADEVLFESDVKRNDSSLSALTGINRKDVREWRNVGQTLPAANMLGPAMEVFTHWKNEPKYLDDNGLPLVLPRNGAKGSFEELAHLVSNDVHPLTILREMERLGIAKRRVEGGGDLVELCLDSFVPNSGMEEMLEMMTANVGDHLAASLQNVVGITAPMLEQSIFADKLSSESTNKLSALAREIWARAHEDIFNVAKPLCDADSANDNAKHRFRIGMYFYQAPPPARKP